MDDVTELQMLRFSDGPLALPSLLGAALLHPAGVPFRPRGHAFISFVLPHVTDPHHLALQHPHN